MSGDIIIGEQAGIDDEAHPLCLAGLQRDLVEGKQATRRSAAGAPAGGSRTARSSSL
ncbi:hypothetical protein MZO42_11490 [Sphingomonas psychrotolerans]|uniref:Uncharacterized protein n=1 Tax=Sphingomonas psychrotolerans TaxID=1327635 RepID=A0ABU3N4C4_9SPHN|nr:hypothetical protein [Sphingomonas psychrotolerans]MDT8759322.1 hypothetical protein [Sphingomonas psychrotolerans]